MSDHPMHGFVRAFCDALAANNPSLMASLIADNAEWTLYGPVDLFSFFGKRQGKTEILAMLAEIGGALRLRGCDSERMLTTGKDAACMMRITARDMRSGRTISLRLALFAQFADGQLHSLRGIFDTFDAVEQVLGRHIDLSAVA